MPDPGPSQGSCRREAGSEEEEAVGPHRQRLARGGHKPKRCLAVPQGGREQELREGTPCGTLDCPQR